MKNQGENPGISKMPLYEQIHHVFLQVVPVPSDCVQEVKDTFMECAESESLELNEIPKHSDIRQVIQEGPFRSL